MKIWELIWNLSTSAIHCTHTWALSLMTYCVYLCHLLISICISSSHSGNILERLDLQLCDVWLLAFVYCTTLGWCSGMWNRRGHHTADATSQTIPTILHLIKIFILNFTWFFCKHHPGKFAPSGTGGSLYITEYQETCLFNRNKFNSVKSYKMNIVQK